ncbi:KV5A1 protein, partial [Amia calva]|nr:KV5A1 protein [Amia calva]MBN3306022.1 KV5A1 protein [Amia calva]
MGLYGFKPGQTPKLLMYELYTQTFTDTRYNGTWQKGTTDFTFSIKNVGPEDAGMYYCGQYHNSPPQ